MRVQCAVCWVGFVEVGFLWGSEMGGEQMG